MKRILLLMTLFVAAIAATAQDRISPKTIVVRDSINIGGVWYSDLSSISCDGDTTGTATTFAELTDVLLSALRNNDVAIYDSVAGKWKNVSITTFFDSAATDTIVMINVDSIYVKSRLSIPRRDTSAYPNPVKGTITFRPADNEFYGWNGTNWDCMTCTIDVSTKLNISDTTAMMANALRRIYRSNDSVYYVNASGAVFAYKDSVGAGGGGSFLPGYGMNLVSTTFNVDTNKIQQKLGWVEIVSQGADTTGVADQTGIFNSALSRIASHGGGTLFLRLGTYNVADSIRTVDGNGNLVNRAQIFLPYAAWSSPNKVHITIKGEVAPVQYTSRRQTVPVTKGVVIKSTITNASGGAVIGTAYNTDSDNPGGFNFNQLTIENVQITTRSKAVDAVTDTVPTIGGVNADHMGYIGMYHSVINTQSAQASSVQPTSAIGFKGPGNGNWARTYLEDVAIYNFYTGIQASEHFTGLHVYVATCYNGIELIAGTHSANFTRPLIQWCVNPIKISGQSYFKFDNLDIEAYSTLSGNPSKWYLPNVDIYEPSTTNSIGLVNYQKTVSNSGVDNASFSVSGTLSPAVKYRTLNDYYTRLGVGTNSPQGPLHVVGTALGSFPTIQASDREIAEHNGDYYKAFATSTTGSAGFRWYDNGAAAWQGQLNYDHSTDQMNFYTNGNATARMSITSGGNLNVGGKVYVDITNGYLGINTTSPQRPLHVRGAGSPTIPSGLGAADYTLEESTGNFNNAKSVGASSLWSTKIYPNGGTIKGGMAYDLASNQWRWTVNGADIATSTAANMLLDSDGDLIIGTGSSSAHSRLVVPGSIALGAWRTITAGRTLDGTDAIIEYTGAGGHTVTLPTAVGIQSRWYTIINASASSLTIATTSSQTIGNTGSDPTSISLAAGASIILFSNNANWRTR